MFPLTAASYYTYVRGDPVVECLTYSGRPHDLVCVDNGQKVGLIDRSLVDEHTAAHGKVPG